ncbi:MAG: transposase family protein [Pseudomonadales bacterium]|nr:transposase family protein [Pseudomonadales bacterium]MBL4864839.1 transposase family protein [Pseudomonadales bacterium]MBL4864857.1 transposase family protein [Pseudomonadales bacterium]MBL4865718.1 transposase family protein [Pseudomonadales bacterium]MBL4868386.1 transposase family protein [Pseudomonadales bacterium]
MNVDKLTTIKSLEDFLQGNQAIAFSVLGNKSERYRFIQKILVRFQYMTCVKNDKGIIIRFLIKITGYSRQQLTRLISQYKKTGRIKWEPCRSHGFSRQYKEKDIRLLAKTDEQHDTPCGHAIKKICERAYHIFDELEYQNLATISVSHLYNLRASTGYQRQRRNFTKTQARKVAIGDRRKPQPNGQPGYIRIDTVHQGDLDKHKGVYHINAVDEVTQFEVVCSVEKISERFLIPILEQILDSFPFEIKGFHSDNGSEYINKTVSKLLEKNLIEFTKSRSRQTNDNAQVESKNASIVRKQFGYQHIEQRWAQEMNQFSLDYLFPYINYHRPCFFPEIKIDDKGKQRKAYPYESMMTPYEKLKSLHDSEKCLKSGVSFEKLDELANKVSDNKAAQILKTEREKLFNLIFEQDKKRA